MIPQPDHWISLPTPIWTQALGRALSQRAQVGDVFALVGDLGTGKSTLARDFIRALTSAAEDVPSPTFTLVQTYDYAAVPIWHMDAYRLTDLSEAQELGLEYAFEDAICLIEWPDRVAEILPPAQTTWIKLDQEADGRRVKLLPPPEAEVRYDNIAREVARWALVLQQDPPYQKLTTIAGDASGRQYFRATSPKTSSETSGETSRAILMDAAALPHVITPFVAASDHLRALGLSAPRTIAVDPQQALLLSEDLGPVAFKDVVADDPQTGYQTFIAALHVLQSSAAPAHWTDHVGPRIMADRVAEELTRFLTWYLPAAQDKAVTPQEQADFIALWHDLLAPSLAAPQVFSVLDCIHDNLFWLPERTGVARIGFIDVQDAVLAPPVYDLMSLLWDVRHPVPQPLRDHLLEHFAGQRDLSFDEAQRDVALWSVQRNLKILGTFIRLAQQEGRVGYMRHLPVVRHMIHEQLGHPALAPVAAWLSTYLTDLHPTPHKSQTP